MFEADTKNIFFWTELTFKYDWLLWDELCVIKI